MVYSQFLLYLETGMILFVRILVKNLIENTLELKEQMLRQIKLSFIDDFSTL